MLIAHRGNLTGPDPQNENNPTYLDRALGLGFDVEVDLWCHSGRLALGHDAPEYDVTMDWLDERASHLWVHCKNVEAIEMVLNSRLNYFYHDTDDYTLTSRGFIWTFPGRAIGSQKFVLVDLERQNPAGRARAAGYCGDYVGTW